MLGFRLMCGKAHPEHPFIITTTRSGMCVCVWVLPFCAHMQIYARAFTFQTSLLSNDTLWLCCRAYILSTKNHQRDTLFAYTIDRAYHHIPKNPSWHIIYGVKKRTNSHTENAPFRALLNPNSYTIYALLSATHIDCMESARIIYRVLKMCILARGLAYICHSPKLILYEQLFFYKWIDTFLVGRNWVRKNDTQLEQIIW